MAPAEEGTLAAACGFHMPAEWEPHAHIWMGWPQRTDNWRNDAMPAQAAFVEVASAISRFTPVTICANASQVENARKQLPEAVEVIEVAQNDSWFRDSGPTFVVKGEAQSGDRELAGIDWVFNAWGGMDGGLYHPWDDDDAVPRKLLGRLGLRRFESPIVLEGGSIHVDGEGTLMTTEECLLNKNRNPMWSKAALEQQLKDMLAVHKVLWLPRGLYKDDDTNGHVDNFACFAAPGVVLLAWTDDESDPQYERSAEALEYLKNHTDATGRQIRVIKVPLPPPLFYTEEEAKGVQQSDVAVPRQAGERLAASYVNFLITNGAVVMPTFGLPEADARAAAAVQSALPDHKIIGIKLGREILLGGGNVHCITQQQPV